MKINKYDVLLGLAAILLMGFSAFEIHFLVFAFLSIICFSKISKQTLNALSYLVLVVIIGLCSALFQEQTPYNLLKDTLYFLKPFFALLSGYLIAKKINNIRRVLKVLTYVTLFFSVYHIIYIFSNTSLLNTSITEIRRVGGISNMILVVIIALIIGSYKFQFLNVVNNKYKKAVFLMVFLLSFTLYFSRTMFVSLFLLLLGIFGYIKITGKGLKYIVMTLIVFGGFYAYLFSVELEREKPGIESFLYKMKIAPSEIFSTVRTVDPKNHAYLWDHWRSYEATVALDQLKTPANYIFGKGFGALIDLKFEAPLSKEKIRYIPVIHNGYVNVLFKTGLLGLLVYVMFLLWIYGVCYHKAKSIENQLYNNVIAGIGVFFVFTSLIITGIYNLEDILSFLLGILFLFKQKTSGLKSLTK